MLGQCRDQVIFHVVEPGQSRISRTLPRTLTASHQSLSLIGQAWALASATVYSRANRLFRRAAVLG